MKNQLNKGRVDNQINKSKVKNPKEVMRVLVLLRNKAVNKANREKRKEESKEDSKEEIKAENKEENKEKIKEEIKELRALQRTKTKANRNSINICEGLVHCIDSKEIPSFINKSFPQTHL